MFEKITLSLTDESKNVIALEENDILIESHLDEIIYVTNAQIQNHLAGSLKESRLAEKFHFARLLKNYIKEIENNDTAF